MRGRTNIVQRTGPTVIGNVVTRKQVTGDRINIGDFVEFTGNTSNWESLSGPFTFRYSKSFEIVTGSVFGEFYIHSISGQCKLIVCNATGIIKITTLSGIDFGTTYADIDDVCCETSGSSKIIYVTRNNKVYVFNIDSNYTMTYNRTINVTFPSHSGGRTNSVIGVRGGYIFCRSMVSSPANDNYIIKMNLDGSTVVSEYSFLVSLVVERRSYISGDYIFIFPMSNTSVTYQRIIFNWKTGNLVVQEEGSNVLLYTEFSHLGKIVNKGNYFFLVGWPYNDTYGVSIYLTIFYIDGNGKINVVDNYSYYMPYFNSHFTNSNRGNFDIFVEENNGTYRIIISQAARGRGSSNYVFNRTIFFHLLTFDSNNNAIVSLDMEEFYWNAETLILMEPENLFLFKNNDTYNLLFTHSNFGDDSDNYLCRTKIIVNNNTIIQSESLDLVKKYESVINGVAKTGGNAGQEISVYVP